MPFPLGKPAFLVHLLIHQPLFSFELSHLSHLFVTILIPPPPCKFQPPETRLFSFNHFEHPTSKTYPSPSLRIRVTIVTRIRTAKVGREIIIYPSGLPLAWIKALKSKARSSVRHNSYSTSPLQIPTPRDSTFFYPCRYCLNKGK